MQHPDSPNDRPEAAPGLRRRLNLARAAIFWERAWPALWPATAVLGIFLALALFDLPERLPGIAHALLLAAMAALLAWTLFRAARHFIPPSRDAAQRRVETASGLAHRPLAALEDRLAGGAGDPATAALWQAHQARMAAAAKSLRIGAPAAGLLRRDPYALRAALALVLLVAAIDAGDDWSGRMLRSLTPSFSPLAAEIPVSLDAWVTPPDYTGLPPQFLSAQSQTGQSTNARPAAAGAAQAPIEIPAGSTLLAQVHGGRGTPHLGLDDKTSEFARIDDSDFKGTATITAGRRLSVSQDGHTLGAWPISVVPDKPPTIAFAKPPQHTDRGVLRLDYKAGDDYGVEGVKAIIHRAGAGPDEIVSLDLPLPGQHLKTAAASSYNDLTPHPWAGLPVEIKLQAKDALNQTGESESIETVLPERVFHNPIAKAIIEARKDLTRRPDDRQPVAETLSDLSVRPGLYHDDVVVFLALRSAQARLMLDHEAAAVPAVQELLWQTALRLEDGRSTQSQQDLRQAMQALQDAIARNAPDEEIQRLMAQVQQAMDRYLQALAQQMKNQGDQQNMPPIDPSRMLSRQDLQKMLDRARDLARTGAKDQAREMLSQLQQMLENLRMARPRQMQTGQSQSMQAMQNMMQRQQQLLDRSFRRSRQPQQGQEGRQGDQQGSQDDSAQQERLRQQLGEMMRQLGDQGDIPAPMAQADRAMRDAVEALKRAQPGQAIGPQTQALDALQQAARAMADQMLGRNGNPDGTDPGDRQGSQQAGRDPFGRLTNQDRGNGGIDDGGDLRLGKANDYAVDKAKQILEELRQRAGDRTRPEIEHDYIDRLLKQF